MFNELHIAIHAVLLGGGILLMIALVDAGLAYVIVLFLRLLEDLLP
jgi:hypothetical protein